MYGLTIIEMAHVVEQEHMRNAIMARAAAQARRDARRLRGPGRVARSWAAFWAPRDFVLVPRSSLGDAPGADLAACADC
jgi:CHASE1-domain containing sensor protein